MRRSLFGSHLYNQIVLPLLLASVVVGVVAWAVTVFFLGNLTDRWVSQVAEGATSSVVERYEQYAAEMVRSAQFVGADRTMSSALQRGDVSEVSDELAATSGTLGYDNLMVLDPRGVVIATEGLPQISPGQQPLSSAELSPSVLGRSRVVLGQLAGGRFLHAIAPVKTSDGTYQVVVSRRVDDAFLTSLSGRVGTAFCLYGPDGTDLACAVGSSVATDKVEAVQGAISDSNPAVIHAIEQARTGAYGLTRINIGGERHQVWASPVRLSDAAGTQPEAFLVGTVSQQVSDDAGRTTTNLIAMWSIVAVVALVGLGGWVARRVSDPLEELSASARRVAEGDFSTKVNIGGSNEIFELAESFNLMTDSLRERSESLTKKVLELATLYEMSRSLGSTLDLDDLLDSVLDSALRIFDVDLGYITLRDRDLGSVSIRCGRGALNVGGGDAVRSTMSDWVVREGRPLIFNPDRRGAAETDAVTGAKAALCVPLVSSEGTIGAITVGSSDPEYRFNSDDVRLLSTIANHVTIAIGNIELFTTLQEAYLATVRSLAAAVDAKDSYTKHHSERVATYATLIAERMGLSHEQRMALEMAAYLHDIGKIGIKEEILLKDGPLSTEEMDEMKKHPMKGASILRPVAFPWAITPVVRHHHEHWDGSGYPSNLKGEEIPLLARILTVADSFEAMTADRPYRKGRDAAAGLLELRRCADTQFDGRIVETFAEILAELEQSGESFVEDTRDDVSPEEARAIFSELVNGVLGSFRDLGGPRLLSNVEHEVDEWSTETGMPFRISRGRVQFITEVPDSADEELEQMVLTLRRLDSAIGRTSGATLMEQFYEEALAGLSVRMRRLSSELGFYVETGASSSSTYGVN